VNGDGISGFVKAGKFFIIWITVRGPVKETPELCRWFNKRYISAYG